MKQKKLYRILIVEFCQYGDTPIELWVWAYSEAQAKLLAAHRFNSQHQFMPNKFLQMEIEEVDN